MNKYQKIVPGRTGQNCEVTSKSQPDRQMEESPPVELPGFSTGELVHHETIRNYLNREYEAKRQRDRINDINKAIIWFLWVAFGVFATLILATLILK